VLGFWGVGYRTRVARPYVSTPRSSFCHGPWWSDPAHPPHTPPRNSEPRTPPALTAARMAKLRARHTPRAGVRNPRGSYRGRCSRAQGRCLRGRRAPNPYTPALTSAGVEPVEARGKRTRYPLRAESTRWLVGGSWAVWAGREPTQAGVEALARYPVTCPPPARRGRVLRCFWSDTDRHRPGSSRRCRGPWRPYPPSPCPTRCPVHPCRGGHLERGGWPWGGPPEGVSTRGRG